MRRELACNGNRETLRRALGPDSIVAWHVRTFREKRMQADAWEADGAGPPMVRLRSPAQTQRWLETLGSPAG